VDNRKSPLLFGALFLGIAVLYLPILVLIVFSFNASSLVSVWGGFSTAWYGQLLHNRQVLDAALLSVEVGFVASTGAVVMGTLAAIALIRFSRFRGRLLLTGMVNAPLVMPEIITGITQLLLFVSMLQLLSWPHRGFTTIVIAHIAFCMAYVTVTVQSRLQSADRSLEEAAMDLGASPARAFIDVTLPIIAPALLSSWLLSFTLSLDDHFQFRLGARRRDAAHGHLFQSEARRQPRHQRARQPDHLRGRRVRHCRRSGAAPLRAPARAGTAGSRALVRRLDARPGTGANPLGGRTDFRGVVEPALDLRCRIDGRVVQDGRIHVSIGGTVIVAVVNFVGNGGDDLRLQDKIQKLVGSVRMRATSSRMLFLGIQFSSATARSMVALSVAFSRGLPMN